MTIEINRPEIEALIRQRLHSGAFASVEDVLFDAGEVGTPMAFAGSIG
jgi:hypothetical protein